MSHEYPESFDEFSNADWEDYLGGPDDELGQAVALPSSEDPQDYDPSYDDDHGAIDEEQVASDEQEPVRQVDLDDERQQDIVLSYIQWEHIASIAKRHDVSELAVASVLNERGAAFYPHPYLERPWENWTTFEDEDERIYLATESIGPAYVDAQHVQMHSTLIRASSVRGLPGFGEWVVTDELNARDKRRLIRFVAGTAGVEAGVRMANHLHDHRLRYLLALQQRDVLAGLEALNAQAMHLRGPFAAIRSMLLSYLRSRLTDHLLKLFEAWSSLAFASRTTLTELDAPDANASIAIDRELFACVPAFEEQPLVIKVIKAIGQRDFQQLERFAQQGDLISKWYCVDRSVRAIKAGDPYRCDLDWSHEVANWQPDPAYVREKLKVSLPVDRPPLAGLISERLACGFAQPWNAP